MTLAKNTIDILGNIFMIQRVVDPQNKKIINFENNSKITESHKCFDFWNTGSACSNCISMRALNENSSFSKLEHLDENLYMIIASPINLNGDTYIVELIKDVTNDTIFSMFNNKTVEDLRKEIHRLNMIAVTDELTSIFNRRYLDENLPVALKNLSTSNFSLSLIMLDIDRFKLINDTYGHLCGDYVIKEIAHLINTYIKTFNGWACRYGGDEFIAVIENISKEKTYEIIETLKNTIDRTPLLYNGNNIKITCSFGVSYLNNSDLNINDALNLVDTKLYEAKKSKDSIC